MTTPLLPAAYFAARALLQPLPGFLTTPECAGVATAMRDSPAQAAAVYAEADPTKISRRTRDVLVPADIQALIRTRLLKQLPGLNAHYGTQASEIQLLQFLRYEPGDYFRPHTDWVEGLVPAMRPRLISFVLFVNAAQDYQGGELVFYLPHAGLGQPVGLALQTEPGMLICFSPTQLHEVREVQGGQRLSVAGWFY